MSKRKHQRKKQISADEKERRQKLAEKRKERQKREKKRNIRDAIAFIAGLILLSVVFILCAIFSEKLLIIFFVVISALAILLFDQSGIRSLIFRWYPDRFPFSDELKKHDHERTLPMQLASTTGWCMFIFMLLSRNRIFSVIWLICIITGLYYMLTDERYSLEKGAKYECSLLYLLLTPTYVLLMLIYNVRITMPFIAFTVIFTVIYNIVYAVNITHGNQKYSRIIYGIIVASFCASSGFLLINKTLDFSEPHEYTLSVEEKDSSRGKSTRYYIYTQDWNNSGELIDITVNSDIYHSLEIGDSVVIETSKGSLGAEYYEYKESVSGGKE